MAEPKPGAQGSTESTTLTLLDRIVAEGRMADRKSVV